MKLRRPLGLALAEAATWPIFGTGAVATALTGEWRWVAVGAVAGLCWSAAVATVKSSIRASEVIRLTEEEGRQQSRIEKKETES